MGGVGLLVLLSVLLAGGGRAAVTVRADPGSYNWDVHMTHSAAPVLPGLCTSNYVDDVIRAGECPDVTSVFQLQGPAGTQSFFDRANAIWYTGPLGADVTGDGIADATDGLVPNRPTGPTGLGAKVGQAHLQVQTNLVVAALPQNNVDDVAAAVDSTVTGQPPTCGAANTLVLQDDLQLWNATTDDSQTVSASQTQMPASYPPGCGTNGLACAPKGVTMMPIGIKALEDVIGLPKQALVSRSFGIAKLPITNGIQSDMDVNFLVYRLHDVGINAYLGITLVQYPGLYSPDPTARGYSPLAQTLKTCPPFVASVTVNGVTSNPDFNEDGVSDLTVTPALNRLVVCPGGTCGPYDYVLALSLAADYDGDGVPSYADRCNTDPNSGRAESDTDGDALTGTCDTNGEGTNPKDGGWNAKWPWDAGQDRDGDGYLNYVDNCPTVPNPDQWDGDGDGVGDLCDPAPTIPGDGKGYANPTPGTYVDYDDLCNDPWTVGTSEGTGDLGRYCLKTDTPATNWNDSNDNGIPDYLDLTALGRGVMADCISDSDSDGLVDAVEAAPPNVQPCAPNITKYGQGTDPLDPDTDGDSVLDGSDNCPLVSNPGQENSDNLIGNGTGIPGNDATVPNGDSLGDACDNDMDNDGIANASDPHPGGDITYDTNGNGNPCVPLGTDAADHGPSWDWNCNGKRDGVESICPLAVNPTGDDDGDGLRNTWEVCKWGTYAYPSTHPLCQGPTPAVGCAPAGVNPQDSDGDGIGDCIEAADTDGNGLVDFGGDAINSARATLLPAGVGAGKFGKDGDFDLNGNNVLAGDFGADTLTVAKIAFKISVCK
jgi:hypothetical protein